MNTITFVDNVADMKSPIQISRKSDKYVPSIYQLSKYIHFENKAKYEQIVNIWFVNRIPKGKLRQDDKI